jgi:DNA-binding HxlR family transcriptional regulator
MDLPLNSESALLRLEALGLIERVPEIRAPVEALRCGYRPTALGWSVLRIMDH